MHKCRVVFADRNKYTVQPCELVCNQMLPSNVYVQEGFCRQKQTHCSAVWTSLCPNVAVQFVRAGIFLQTETNTVQPCELVCAQMLQSSVYVQECRNKHTVQPCELVCALMLQSSVYVQECFCRQKQTLFSRAYLFVTKCYSPMCTCRNVFFQQKQTHCSAVRTGL